jgi:hypothetical protein
MGKPRKPKTPKPSWLARLIREPLLQFVLLGASLFYVNYLIAADQPEPEPEPEPSDTRESIVVTQTTIDEMVKRHAELQHAEVSEVQRQGLINAHIEDEILVREAYRQGLDRDSQIRDMVLRKMRYVLEAEKPEEERSEDAVPTSDQLRSCYKTNRLRFHVPRTVTLEQVYFPKGRKPEVGLLEKLKAGAGHREFGEPIASLERIKRAYLQRELALHIGPKFAIRVFELPPGEWTGPIDSLRGKHFVRVIEIHPSREPSFDEVEEIIRRDWPIFRPRQTVSDKVAEFRKEYDVEIGKEPPVSATP